MARVSVQVQVRSRRSFLDSDYQLLTHFKRSLLDRTKASKQAVYEKVLEIGKSDPEAIYLDAGCFSEPLDSHRSCVVPWADQHLFWMMIAGTDVRKLVYDGWNADRVIGTDLRKGSSSRPWSSIRLDQADQLYNVSITFL